MEIKLKIMGKEIISYIPEAEVENNACMAKIHFDCKLTMYDMGFKKERDSSMFTLRVKQSVSKPHWFKLETKLTLEAIEHSDPYELGIHLKNSKKRLDEYIENSMK